MHKIKHAIAVTAALLLEGSAVMAQNLTLHYDRPAQYFEEALVIGNGNLGATIYGSPKKDRLSLNDITLWTGEPEKGAYAPEAYKSIPLIREALDRGEYRAADSLQRDVQGHYSENYQPLGTLTIDYGQRTEASVTDYSRKLDISDAVATTAYRVQDRLCVTDYFASAPDSVIVVHLKSDAPGGIEATIGFDSQLPVEVKAAGREITADGYAAYHSLPHYTRYEQKHFYDPERGIHFRTLIHVTTPDGSVTPTADNRLSIKGCNEAIVVLTNVTSFNGFDKDPVKEGRDYKTLARNRIDAATAKSYDTLLSNHTADYRNIFDRVKIDLGTTDASIAALPTDVQLKLYTDSAQTNPDLEELYFQFGRYLLISSSRTPGVPANLQGLWNESVLPPWSSNYTTNINLEENYWGAETTNLTELHNPLLEFIGNLSKSGAVTAKAFYGVPEGWSLAHNSDIWATTNPVGLNEGHPSWANWAMGGAWLATHLWEHYLFTQNKEWLEVNYPILKSAALFCLNWLTEKDGKLITSPATSPENVFITPDGYAGATAYGATADLAMTRQCLMDTRNAAATLGIDKDLRDRIDITLNRLHPYSIGAKGNLQEWYYDWEDQDPRHRHQSHLFGLYPGRHIDTANTPDLAKAAARTLEIKGDETTGWSTGWRVNLFARLGDAPSAYHIYRKLLRYISPDQYQGEDARRGGGTYPNLLDAHSPFQIDGNFGGSAGVAEMLLQSTPETITILPALPEQWADGSVSGLRARGGWEVSMVWKDGKARTVTLSTQTGGTTTVIVNGKEHQVTLKPGESRSII